MGRSKPLDRYYSVVNPRDNERSLALFAADTPPEYDPRLGAT
jgi:hypothetical protein